MDTGQDVNTKDPKLWASILRLLAIPPIYVHHFLTINSDTLEYNHKLSYILAICGLNIFCFLSGYFSSRETPSPNRWIAGRVKRIMIPYWLVIVPVILLNFIVGYKKVGLQDVITILVGGSWFMKDCLYIVSWFVTMFLIFYFLVYAIRLARFLSLKIVLLSMVAFFLYRVHGPIALVCLLSFMSGYLGRKAGLFEVPRSGLRNKLYFARLNMRLFDIQSYSYSFILIHGGCLIFFAVILKARPLFAFFGAAMTACAVSYYHKRISDILIARGVEGMRRSQSKVFTR